MKRSRTIALVGNQNCGKTTLFNQLTGQNQHVGNWPGVTVEKRTGALRTRAAADGVSVAIVDLPGIYSLSPYSIEELVSRDFVVEERPDLILNCVDATNLERNLYLTLQLILLERPVVLALNMMDEARKRGLRIDVSALEQALGVPVVPISARRAEGIGDLIACAGRTIDETRVPSVALMAEGAVGETQRAVMRLTERQASEAGVPARYAATKLLEGDRSMAERLALDDTARRAIERELTAMESALGIERAAAVADARYRVIEAIVAQCVAKPVEPERSATDRIDGVLTHPWLAIPLFLLMMALVFFVTFGSIGAGIAAWFGELIDGGIALMARALRNWGASESIRELLISGVLRGVGSVLRFLPTILLLFLLLSILEDSGYMARAAFLMDRPLRSIGLNGRSFIPLLMGFGCTVPAVMSARGMNTRRDRRFTILLTPLMSCGAKAPIYALFAQVYAPGLGLPLMVSLYAIGVLLAIAAGQCLKRTAFRGEAAPFLMELPPYRMPAPRNVLRQLREKAGDFLQRAFTVIFLATLLVWCLSSFTIGLEAARDVESSMLGQLAGAIAPIFAPAGFGNVPAATAVLTGLMAKESIISSLAVLGNVRADGLAMAETLRASFPTVLSAVSFLLFTLLYSPCVAAVATMRRELESGRLALLAALSQTALAWIVATVFYQLGRCFG